MKQILNKQGDHETNHDNQCLNYRESTQDWEGVERSQLEDHGTNHKIATNSEKVYLYSYNY